MDRLAWLKDWGWGWPSVSALPKSWPWIGSAPDPNEPVTPVYVEWMFGILTVLVSIYVFYNTVRMGYTILRFTFWVVFATCLVYTIGSILPASCDRFVREALFAWQWFDRTMERTAFKRIVIEPLLRLIRAQ